MKNFLLSKYRALMTEKGHYQFREKVIFFPLFSE
jgi:hypothetical protein